MAASKRKGSDTITDEEIKKIKGNDELVEKQSPQRAVTVVEPEVKFGLLISLDLSDKLQKDGYKEDLEKKFDVKIDLKPAKSGALDNVMNVNGCSCSILELFTSLLKNDILHGDCIQFIFTSSAHNAIMAFLQDNQSHTLPTESWVASVTAGLPGSSEKLVLLEPESAKDNTIKLINAICATSKSGDHVDGYGKSIFSGGFGYQFEIQAANEQLMKLSTRMKQNTDLGRTNGILTSIENMPAAGEAEELAAGLPPNGVALITTKTGFFQAKNQLHSLAVARKSDSQTITLRVRVPQEYVGGLIGKAGSRITEMRNLSGANLRVDMGNDRNDPEGERVVAIHGSSDQVRVALNLLNKRLELEMQNSRGR